MQYRVVERYYGPAIRPEDWKTTEGTVTALDGDLSIQGDARAEIIRNDCPFGAGGDVELALSFSFRDMEQQGSLMLHFNRIPKDPHGRGMRVLYDHENLVVYLRDRELCNKPHHGCEPERLHRVRFVTLGELFSLWYDGECLASGSMEPPYSDNEGWMTIGVRRATVDLLSFEESFIAHDVDVPDWHRTELLYEESFGEDAFDESWVCNEAGPEAGPEFLPDAYVFRHMCNCLLRFPFEGPIAVDCVATPMPTTDFSAGVTDAIFIWMATNPEGDLVEYLDEKTEAGEAGLDIMSPLPFYWVDLGGSNNITTRLRKNPNRHLMRQFTDPPRLLERDRSYRVTCVQNGHFVEFWIDDQPLTRIYDAHPLTEGHVGFRAFCADLKIEALKVWRIED